MNILEISKAEVLGRDFTRVRELLQDIACSAQELQDTRNTWDLLFTGYEDDPRDIPEMAEVNRWVRASLEEGIPWLYLLGSGEDYTGLHLLLLCCCTHPDPDQPEARLLDPQAVDGFVSQGMRSVGDFGADHNIPEEILAAAVHRSMDFIYQLLAEEQEDLENGENPDETAEDEPSPLEIEIQERLQILLENTAVPGITLAPKVLYCSEPQPDGTCRIHPVADSPAYQQMSALLAQQVSMPMYFLLIAPDGKLAYLFVSPDKSRWEEEKDDLADCNPLAVVLDPVEGTAIVQRVQLDPCGGGPAVALE